MDGKAAIDTDLGPERRRLSWAFLGVGLTGLALALAFADRSEFLAVNLYVTTWWSFVLALEGANGLRGRPLFMGKSGGWFLKVCGISAFLWFVFEFYNFWLGNWYYVGLPANEAWRLIGTFVAFATVLPGMWEVERTIVEIVPEGLDDAPGIGVSLPFRIFLGLVALLGVVGPFVAPDWTFPFVWGGLWAAVELLEYRAGGPSFLAEMKRGEYRELVAWLVTGGVCGFIWEFWNSFAVCKWIYTVPGLGETRLFEMPLPGFLGFVPFAPMTWRLFESMYARYEDWDGSVRWTFWLAIGLFSVGVRWGMVDLTGVSVYPDDVRSFEGWTAEERRLIEGTGARTPRQVASAVDSTQIREKLAFLEFGGIWIETGNCLWAAGYRSIPALRRASVDELTETVTGCRSGPEAFWRRRVLDWKQRPIPVEDATSPRARK